MYRNSVEQTEREVLCVYLLTFWGVLVGVVRRAALVVMIPVGRVSVLVGYQH